jgi:hypothetical protein
METPKPEHEKRILRARSIDGDSVHAVIDLDYGRYLVVSASGSAHFLGVGSESSSVVRSSHEPAAEREWEAVPLRRDGEAVPLLGIIELQLGRRAVLRIDVRGDGIETTRTTTTPAKTLRRAAI